MIPYDKFRFHFTFFIYDEFHADIILKEQQQYVN